MQWALLEQDGNKEKSNLYRADDDPTLTAEPWKRNQQ
jgi:hypothetical protein